MRIAHFSDFHLGAGVLSAQIRRMRALVDHALDGGAEHLMFSGDLVDHGNVGDARALADHLRARRMFTADGFSLVFGNHDIWPISWSGDLPGRAMRWFRSQAAALILNREPPGQKNYDALASLFSPAFASATAMSDEDPFPSVKRVGPVAIGMLDTTADTVFEHARGRFDEEEAAWVDEELDRVGGLPLLLAHHWPFSWGVDDIPDVEDVLEPLPFLVRKGVEAAFDVDQLVEDFTNVNFGDLRSVQGFIRRSSALAMFCGHLHADGNGMHSSGFKRVLGRKTVYCMGRSGAIDQDEDPEYAYHLVDAGAGRFTVKTVYVSEADLDVGRVRRGRAANARSTGARSVKKRPAKK